jgi:hypothetical protein
LLSAKSFASPLPIPDVAPIIIAFFILNFVCLLCRPTMRHNVLQLQEVGDFYHKTSYEALMFVEPQNCHTKH